ncbi:MAG TPA: GNAT family N-acetyltransferase, partial [Acidimicrobiia bacterium]|nr:GNAT family N-acetyltransferase [Acidimicrobiia bacterium]
MTLDTTERLAMGGQGYPADLEADVVLADGGTVHVRPIRPSDTDALVQFHERLSPETVYYRFFTAKPTLPSDVADRFTHVDYSERLALVAELGDELVAVVRYDRLPASDEADVAFVVADEHQGRGIGTILLEHLATAARKRGIRRFVADTLATNRRMIDLFASMGFELEHSFEGGVVHVAFPIEPTAR